MGEELFEHYPQFANINGNLVGIRNVSKKFVDESLLKIHSLSKTTDNLLKLIELRNYIESSWYIDLGLNSNYNMKRESLTDSETEVDTYTLTPLIKNMLEERQNGIKRINEKWDLNVSVDLGGSWKKLFEKILSNNEGVNDGTSEN